MAGSLKFKITSPLGETKSSVSSKSDLHVLVYTGSKVTISLSKYLHISRQVTESEVKLPGLLDKILTNINTPLSSYDAIGLDLLMNLEIKHSSQTLCFIKQA